MGRRPRPQRLEFRTRGRELWGFDPDNSVDYLIRFCGNGAYSHYWLTPSDDPSTGLYVYVYVYTHAYQDDPLLNSIASAEKRLVFGVT